MKHKANDLDPAKVCANLIGDARKICFKPAVVRKRLGGLIYPLCKECAENINGQSINVNIAIGTEGTSR